MTNQEYRFFRKWYWPALAAAFLVFMATAMLS